MAGASEASRAWISGHHAQLALSVRVAVAALVSLLLSQVLRLPMPLWAVLPAIILTQMSFGSTFKAVVDYFLGTLAGAVYAGFLATLIPPGNETELLMLLLLVVVPAALVAALNRSFGAAPLTAVLVLLIPTITHVSSLQSALFRLAEVGTGGVTAVFVSLMVLPTSPQAMMIDAAAEVMSLMAQALPDLILGLTRSVDPASMLTLQDRTDEALARLDPIVTGAGHERVMWLASYVDPAPLQRTLLRLRQDFGMIGRSPLTPLQDSLKARIAPTLAHIAETAQNILHDSATALRSRRGPPSLDVARKALGAFSAEIDAMRSDGSLRELPGDALERIFTLAFSLDRLEKNFGDLARCVSEWALKRTK